MSMNYNELESAPGLQATSSFTFIYDLKLIPSFDAGTSYLPANEIFELHVELDDHPNKRAKLAPTSFKFPLLKECEEKMPTCCYTQEMETEFLKDRDQDLDEDITTSLFSTRQSEHRGSDGAGSHLPEEDCASESGMGTYFDASTPTVLNQNIRPLPIDPPQITQNISPVTTTTAEEEVKNEKDSESDGDSVSDGEEEEEEDYEEPKRRGYNKRIAPEVTNGHIKAGRWTYVEHDRLKEAYREYEGKRGSWKKVADLVEGRTPAQCKSHWQKFQKTSFVEKNINIDELKKSKKYLQKEMEEIKAYGLKPFALNGNTTLDEGKLLLVINYLIKDIDSKLNTVSLNERKSNKKDKKQNKKRNISE